MARQQQQQQKEEEEEEEQQHAMSPMGAASPGGGARSAEPSRALLLVLETIKVLGDPGGSTIRRIARYLASKCPGEQRPGLPRVLVRGSTDRLRLSATVRKAVAEGTEAKVLVVSGDGQLFRLASKRRPQKRKAAGGGRHRDKKKARKARPAGRRGCKPKAGRRAVRPRPDRAGKPSTKGRQVPKHKAQKRRR